jgi:hypothetical protein
MMGISDASNAPRIPPKALSGAEGADIQEQQKVEAEKKAAVFTLSAFSLFITVLKELVKTKNESMQISARTGDEIISSQEDIRKRLATQADVTRTAKEVGKHDSAKNQAVLNEEETKSKLYGVLTEHAKGKLNLLNQSTSVFMAHSQTDASASQSDSQEFSKALTTQRDMTKEAGSNLQGKK